MIYDFTAVAKTQKSRNLFSGEFQVIIFGPMNKNDNSDFFLRRIMLESEIPSSKLSFFTIYPKTITHIFIFTNGIGSWLEVKISQSTKAFNSENIVQVRLVSSRTHKVNKDLSNSVKEFQVILFWCRAINDNSGCFSKVWILLNLNTHELSLSHRMSTGL